VPIGGTILYDSSVIDRAPDIGPGRHVHAVPFARIAAELGSPVVKNVVALGALQAATEIFPPETFLAAIRQALKDKCALVPRNEEAFERGRTALGDPARVG
jgi:Pyruvate/2-oxoacid:ferredoxin oxidoreductase gamma subunit